MFKKLNKDIPNLFSFIAIFLFLILINIPLPYNIDTPGGVINIMDRVEVKGTKSYGSINMTYVSGVKATPITMLYAKINPNWDTISKKEENGTSTEKEALFMDKISREASEDGAIITAYKYSNKKINIKKAYINVTYIFEEAKTNLKVGDIIKAIDDIEVNSRNDVRELVRSKKRGDTINIKVINNEKEYIRQAQIIEIENDKYIGIRYDITYDYETNPSVKVKFEDNERGPSGGLMLALAIYSKINNIDITNGYKISGTGSINDEGKVGEIGGIKYKIKGAVDNKMDVFICPKENYKEAIKEKENKNYKIKIYGVSNFEEALNVLKNLEE